MSAFQTLKQTHKNASTCCHTADVCPSFESKSNSNSKTVHKYLNYMNLLKRNTIGLLYHHDNLNKCVNQCNPHLLIDSVEKLAVVKNAAKIHYSVEYEIGKGHFSSLFSCRDKRLHSMNTNGNSFRNDCFAVKVTYIYIYVIWLLV